MYIYCPFSSLIFSHSVSFPVNHCILMALSHEWVEKIKKKKLNWNLQSYMSCLRMSLRCCFSGRCFHIYLSYRYSLSRLPITCLPVHMSEKPMKSCLVLICQWEGVLNSQANSSIHPASLLTLDAKYILS